MWSFMTSGQINLENLYLAGLKRNSVKKKTKGGEKLNTIQKRYVLSKKKEKFSCFYLLKIVKTGRKFD